MSEPPGAIRAAMMSTWGPVHADGPCVIANPEVLDGMLAALEAAEYRLAVGDKDLGVLMQVRAAIAECEGGDDG